MLRHAVALAGKAACETVDLLLRQEIEPAPKAGEIGRGRVRKRTTLPNSETADRHLARLKRDDPALAEKVVNGEVSAYAAARSKGWKPPRIQVTTAARTASQLRKYMTTEQLAELAQLLSDEAKGVTLMKSFIEFRSILD